MSTINPSSWLPQILGPVNLADAQASGTSYVIQWDPTTQAYIAIDAAFVGNRAGTYTLEQFGAKGDGSSDDTPAFNRAAAAAKLGTFKALQLGAKTYLLNSATSSWPFGVDIVGVGAQSVLKTTALNEPMLKVYSSVAGNRAKSTRFSNFMLLGSIGTTPGNTTQDGIDIGYFGADGSSRITVDGVIAKQLAGVGFVCTSGDDVAFGPLFIGCTADGCWKGGVFAYPSEAVGCRFVGCTLWGIGAGGNFSMTGGFVENCLVGMYVSAGGNDSHGQITGVSFLHNTTQVQTQDGLGNGQFFGDCRIYEGALVIGTTTRGVTFNACLLDLTSYSFTGKARLLNCSFDDGYSNTLSTVSGAEVEVINPRALKMSIPAWVGNLVQQTYTFASDASLTLASQVAWAQELDIQAGVITAARTLTLGTRPPNKGQRIKVKNRTAYAVTIQWATGTGVSVTAGATGTIGADGTNAVDWSDNLPAAAAYDPIQTSWTGFWRGSFTASPWTGTASAGTSGTHNMANGVAPGVGSAVNGFTPATFNGTTQYLTDAGNAANVYLSTTDYTISGVINPTTAPAAAGSVFNNPGVLTETGGNFGVVYSAAGIQVYHSSTLVGTLALGTGSWKSFDIKYTGGVLSMRLGNAAWTTFTVGGTGSISTNPLRIGSNFNASAILSASFMELELAATGISDAILNSNYAFKQARYPAMGL